MKAEQVDFISSYLPLARKAGESFRINPIVILAQAVIELGVHSLRFRVYDTPQDSFMDYARLIRHAYTPAADVSNNPQAFARSISYSRYISEVNGDNREAYRILLIKLCRQIEKIKD